MAHRSGINAFLGGRCPQCRKGKIFKYSVFNFLNFKKTHIHCPHCRVKFESEPGFFWGAMYFSYALNVGLAIFMGVLFFNLYEDPPLTPMVLVVLGVSAVASPFVFRLARLLMMYIASPYRKFNKFL
ncbi:MAG: DUF983 domain-containing protein [Bacteroidia bacterium]